MAQCLALWSLLLLWFYWKNTLGVNLFSLLEQPLPDVYAQAGKTLDLSHISP
jgi:hypothetical protein